MDAELFSESIEYERLTRSIYQAIVEADVNTVEVRHDEKVKGRSGVEHQVDVLWEFSLAGVKHKVLVECKNYSSNLTLEKVRNFYGVLSDVGNCQGVMVTKTGFQSGAAQFGQFYGIGLKVLRAPTDADWEGLIETVDLRIYLKSAVSTAERPLTVNIGFDYDDAGQQERVKNLYSQGRLHVSDESRLRFFTSRNRDELTDELRWILPRELDVLSYEDGGPYQQRIPLDQHYLLFCEGTNDEELVRVSHLDVSYYVETVEDREIVVHGRQTVDVILRDFESGEVEYVRHTADRR